MSCIFCNLLTDQVILENDHFVLIADKFPVSKGHLLVISKRHFEDFFELAESEIPAFHELITKARAFLEDTYSPQGYNLGMNCGRVAGQSVPHFHLHIIPRYIDKQQNQIRGMREYIKEIL